jgi:murein DD-endopeptidase MepM/ murein hydrolase activator NlpD
LLIVVAVIKPRKGQNMSYPIPEPPFHDDDTNPSIAVRPEGFDERLQASLNPEPKRSNPLGWLSLLGAMALTISTLVVLLMPGTPSPEPIIVEAPTNAVVATEASISSQEAPTLEPVEVGANSSLPPVVAAEQLNVVLQAPIKDTILMSYRYEPFTLVNSERARSSFIDYVAVSGDTIDGISNRYGLKAESIAWCNDRRIVQVLRPGDVVRIPPVDGACHRVLGSAEETIASIAAKFSVEDPFTIIDSPYNYGQIASSIGPDDILPGGTTLFIPNGIGEVISWNAAVTEKDANGNVIGLSFAPGQAGSCQGVTPSGGSYWGNPLPNGTWVRGFYAGHSGLDLSASTGTPVFAANSGQVLFSGYSNWGYGEAVVIEHGATYSTLYGHMSSRNVRCGQSVVTGQIIGFVGSTGNSSGPHLHFEIQVNGQATDPSGTPGIGW